MKRSIQSQLEDYLLDTYNKYDIGYQLCIFKDVHSFASVELFLRSNPAHTMPINWSLIEKGILPTRPFNSIPTHHESIPRKCLFDERLLRFFPQAWEEFMKLMQTETPFDKFVFIESSLEKPLVN